MRQLSADVVVIGGGTTGVGVVRDVAMRGYKAILLDRADLAQGTSGRFHGLLHSGGRYVVTDPLSGTECAEENAILGHIQAGAIERTGGLFFTLPGDPDPDWGDKFLAGAATAKVPVEEIEPSRALKLEPRMNPTAERVFRVEDGSVDGWQLAWSAAASAKQYGAQILTYTKATEITTAGGRVTGVRATDAKTGEDVTIDCGFVLNCAGPWAGGVAAMAGCEPVAVVPGRGIMIAADRFTNVVLNLCVKPADGDIIVPCHGVSIIGTTDVKADDPDHLPIPADEVQKMLDAGEKLAPGFRQQRLLHVWTGARPLIKDDRVAASDTRHMSRGMAVVDHSTRDGLKGLLTIGGGKLTTYRLMAEHIVDAMEDQTGDHHPCRTAEEPCPGHEPGRYFALNHRLKEREADRLSDQIICECELMSRTMFTDLLKEQPNATLDDLRRQLRLGMGPCQGGFCSSRAAGLAFEEGAIDIERATGLLRLFLTNRWYGLWPVLNGQQVAQAALDDWILQGLLDIGHLPAQTKEVI
ncbi:MAG: anaerobic glycerol-3-phosphate dehydrogenase subunit A [Propionibacteriaceae bacterium]|jgi:glycerol-3-phosphate dehydrogenase|nr:anaerobic glycerol-3-phosphate dehydrogenase subunit A [Propionibacteriaceae bacterium]